MGERYRVAIPRAIYAPPEELRIVMGEPVGLTHPEAPGDTGHPTFYFGLPAFPREGFVRYPYHNEGVRPAY